MSSLPGLLCRFGKRHLLRTVWRRSIVSNTKSLTVKKISSQGVCVGPMLKWRECISASRLCRQSQGKLVVTFLTVTNVFLITLVFNGYIFFDKESLEPAADAPDDAGRLRQTLPMLAVDIADSAGRPRQSAGNSTRGNVGAERAASQGDSRQHQMDEMDAVVKSRMVKNSNWHVFTKGSIWDPANKSPQIGWKRALGVELLVVVRSAVAQLNKVPPPGAANYTERSFLDGRYKNVPGAGVMYVLHFVSATEPGQVETVRLVRRQGPLLVETLGGYDHGELIYVVVPYYHRPDVFSQFAAMFEQLVLAHHENLLLVLMFYWRGQPAVARDVLERDHRTVAQTLQRINRRAGRRVARLIAQDAEFSRGHALLHGARSWTQSRDVLLFFCDVDMFVDVKALHRCRANASPGQRVYYPVVFSTFNPELHARAWRKKKASLWEQHPLSGDVGYWRDFGYGMTCQYKSDFDRVGGEFLVLRGWGGEDIQLHRRYGKSDIEVVRAADPGLVHIYHPKTCDRQLLGKKYGACIGSLLHSEASMKTWAQFVKRLQSRVNNPERVRDMLLEIGDYGADEGAETADAAKVKAADAAA